MVATTHRIMSGVHWAKSTQVTSTPARMMTPPIVGVPCFTRCVCGPSARTCWPMPSLRMSLMKGGMSRAVMRPATIRVTKTW